MTENIGRYREDTQLAPYRDRRRVNANFIRNRGRPRQKCDTEQVERPQSLWIGLSRNTEQQTSKAPASPPIKKPSVQLGDTERQAVGGTSNRLSPSRHQQSLTEE